MIEFENEAAEQKLEKALAIYQEKFLSSLPSDEELGKICFSNEFENKMGKLIKSQKKPYYIFINTVGRRVAVVALVIFLSLTTTIFSVEALRRPVIDFFVEIYEKFSTVIFIKDDEEAKLPEVIEEVYEPSFIPEGYVETEKLEFIGFIQIEYTNENGEIILFEQKTISNNQMNINTEGMESKSILINDFEGIFWSNKGHYSLIWNDGVYIYSISCAISKNVLVQIAESVEIKR